MSRAFFLLSLIATSSLAYRIDFSTLVDEKRIAGSEVCFFPSTLTNQLARDFGSGDIRCLPADQEIELPPGGWSFFAHHEDGFISHWPGHAIVPDGSDGFSGLDVPMFPATTVKLHAIPGTEARAGERLVVFFPQTGKTPSYSRPVPVGAQEIVVPAGADWYLVRVANGVPAWLSQRRPDRAHTVAPKGTFDVLVALDVRPGSLELPTAQLRTPAETLLPPSQQPRHRLPPDLILFEDVPRRAGTYEVVLDPEGWSDERIRFAAPAGDLVVWPGAPPSTGEVEIEVPEQMLMRVITPDDCLHGSTNRKISIIGSDWQPAEEAKAEILSCPDPAAGNCTVIASGPLEAPLTTLSVPEGVWTLRIALPYRLQPLTEPVTVVAGEATTSGLVSSLPMMRGTVTRQGVPVVARVEFPSGVALSDEAGTFTAPIRSYERSSLVPIKVERCEEDRVYTIFPEDDELEARWLSLELSESSIAIEVSDASDESPIAGARTQTIARLTEPNRPGAVHSGVGPVTGEDGKAVLENIRLPHGSEICASHAEYERACVEYEGGSSILIAMKPLPRVRGRILTDGPIRGGRLAVVTPGIPQPVGQAEVAPDGSFVLRQQPGATTYAVFASLTHPLLLFVPAEYPDLQIPFPAAAPSTLVVSSSLPGTPVGLSIGGRVVPTETFRFHQMVRGNTDVIPETGPLQIPAILATGPLLIHAGPLVPPPGLRPGDIFLMPEWLSTFAAAMPDQAGKVSLP